MFSDYIKLSRLNRPMGILLLLFPGLVGLSASKGLVPQTYWLLFIIGATVMRSAGCIYNDIVDHPFDGKVRRTNNRPLVRSSNPLTLPWAVFFLVLNLAVGFVVLIHFNAVTILIGLVTALMIALYPWMKRITYWPQLFLGMTMNMGFVIGWAAMETLLDINMVLIYSGMILWTLGYDTIYGFQDMDDDALIGVKSATFKMYAAPRVLVSFIYGLALLCWIVAGLFQDSLFVVYYICLVAIAIVLAWQTLTLNIQDSENCLVRFRSNQWVGLLLFLGFISQEL